MLRRRLPSRWRRMKRGRGGPCSSRAHPATGTTGTSYACLVCSCSKMECKAMIACLRDSGVLVAWCHAYQILQKGGVEEENIVVFMYDDIAHNILNPRPGVIINHPKGENVYTGVPKDYTVDQVTA
uniref:Uncharacterized protein n=1 Tax=Arundo donax TaxID=35708 RepID=A0A0A9D2J0_ARUDO